jgi:integrase
MTHFRLRYVQAFVDRKTGAVFQYFRRPGFPRVRLPGLPGSSEFMTAYQAALDGPRLEIGTSRSNPGSIAAAVAAYLVSPEFTTQGTTGRLARGTQVMRRAILQRLRDQYGDHPIGSMPPKFIALMLGKMKPHAARNWFKAIRALCQFAVNMEMIEGDPTQGFKLPRVVKSDGHHTWSEAEIEQYEAAHPIGTKARLALALALYTCQRRSDVIKMGRQHVRDGVLTVRQEKTRIVLDIPVHGKLREIIDATPGEHLTFLVTRSGKPFGGSDFSDQFRMWCNQAGLPRACVVHGLRKAACRRLAEAGCSANEIASISGHATLKEVERYTRAADQARMARNAMARGMPENITTTSSVKSTGV